MNAETPDTPAVRAARRLAETRRFQLRGTALALAMHGSSDERIQAHNDAERAFEDAVAARVTAELMASGTPMHVATDEWPIPDGAQCRLFLNEPSPFTTRGRIEYASQNFCFMTLPVQLTPPGTVRQAVLLIPEATDGR